METHRFREFKDPILSRQSPNRWQSALRPDLALPSKNIPGNQLSYRLSQTQCHIAAGRIGSTGKSSDVISNGTHTYTRTDIY
jgi:hypothetical protein